MSSAWCRAWCWRCCCSSSPVCPSRLGHEDMPDMTRLRWRQRIFRVPSAAWPSQDGLHNAHFILHFILRPLFLYPFERPSFEEEQLAFAASAAPLPTTIYISQRVSKKTCVYDFGLSIKCRPCVKCLSLLPSSFHWALRSFSLTCPCPVLPTALWLCFSLCK